MPTRNWPGPASNIWQQLGVWTWKSYQPMRFPCEIGHISTRIADSIWQKSESVSFNRMLETLLQRHRVSFFNIPVRKGSKTSGAARALVKGVKLAMDWPSGRVGSLPKMKASRFSPTLLSRGPLYGINWTPLSLGWSPWGLKLIILDKTWTLQSMSNVYFHWILTVKGCST